MRTFSRVLALAVTLLPVSDLALAAWGTNPATNLALCTAPNEQYYSGACSDGTGGAIVAWSDFRTGAGDVYARRVSASGTVMWEHNGKAICTLWFSQYQTRIISDGAGGAYIVWADGRKDGSDYDIYAQRVDANGNALWTPEGVRVCGAAGVQDSPLIAPDGAGGAIVAWSDSRPGSPGLWAQRISADSTVSWTADGVRMSTAAVSGSVFIASDGQGGALFVWSTGITTNQMIVQGVDPLGTPRWGNGVVVANGNPNRYAFPDGAGGFIVGWENQSYIFARHFDQAGSLIWTRTVYVGGSGMLMDTDGASGAFMCWQRGNNDLVAQHLDVFGNLAWTADGALVVPAPGHNFCALKADGEGGVAFAWSDYRAGPNADIYAQRLDASGTPRFPPSGTAVSTATSPQYFSNLVPSTNGGWIVVWEDYRGGSSRDIYCQGIDRYGALGDASPQLLSVSDVPGDNGGFLRLQWSHSYLDRAVDPRVVEYRLLRQTPGPGPGSRAAPPTTSGWEVIVTVPATAAPTYAVAVPSDGDDVGGIHPITTYRVEAHGSSSEAEPLWSSEAMGGWSVDNLAPPTPTGFLGAYTNGITAMTWDASTAPDIALYRLWGSPDQLFVAGPNNLIAETSGTSFTDRPGEAYYYRLAAVDDNGNQSQLRPMQAWTTDVEPATHMTFALAAPQPNPAQRECTITFEVPREGSARLALFDLAGRRVATLHEGPIDAGPHVVSLTVDSAEGSRLSNGLYVLRLEAAGRTATRRLVIAR